MDEKKIHRNVEIRIINHKGVVVIRKRIKQ